MRLTPLDIRKQEFRKAMRGLDADEVYAFLSTVADEYEAVLNDNKALRERVLELDDKVQEYRNMEKTLRDTLLTAERVTVEAKDNARREADLIVKEAELEAESGVRHIKNTAVRLRQEILSLRQQRDAYIGRMRMIVESHLQFLKTAENDFTEEDRQIEAHRATDADTLERKKTEPRAAKQTAPVVEPPAVSTPVEKPATSSLSTAARPAVAPTPAPVVPELPQEPALDGQTPIAEQAEQAEQVAPVSTAVMSDDSSSRLNTILERLVGRGRKTAADDKGRPEFAEIPDPAPTAPRTADAASSTHQTPPPPENVQAPPENTQAPAGPAHPAATAAIGVERDALEPNPVTPQPGQWSLDKLKQDILARSQKKDEKN